MKEEVIAEGGDKKSTRPSAPGALKIPARKIKKLTKAESVMTPNDLIKESSLVGGDKPLRRKSLDRGSLLVKVHQQDFMKEYS